MTIDCVENVTSYLTVPYIDLSDKGTLIKTQTLKPVKAKIVTQQAWFHLEGWWISQQNGPVGSKNIINGTA